jgi:hypothetical protein
MISASRLVNWKFMVLAKHYHSSFVVLGFYHRMLSVERTVVREAVALERLSLTALLLSGINTPAAYSSLPPDATSIRASFPAIGTAHTLIAGAFGRTTAEANRNCSNIPAGVGAASFERRSACLE